MNQGNVVRVERTLCPLVLLLDLGLGKVMCQQRCTKEPRKSTDLFFRREVVDDVEELANLLGRLALDHVRHRLAADVAMIRS